MNPDLASYLAKQQTRLFTEAAGFIAALQVGVRPLGGGKENPLDIFNEINVLLALHDNLDKYNAEADRGAWARIERAEVRDCLFQSIVFAFEFLDENSFISGWDIDGKLIADVFYFWGNLLCLDAFAKLGAEYSERLQPFIRRTRSGAERALKNIARYAEGDIKAYRGLNLIFLDIATLHRAGEYFSEPTWVAIAIKANERLLKRFDTEGFMPDSRDEDVDVGPSSTYFLFTLYTVSYYCRVICDRQLMLALQRSVDWHLRMTYPNGQPIEIADERGRQRSGTAIELCNNGLVFRSPLLLCSDGGRALVQHWEAGASAQYPLTIVANDLNFFNAVPPSLIEVLDQPSSAWFANAPIHYYRHQNGKSAVLREGNWVFSFHGYLTGPLDPKGMWHRELQQHVAVYYHGVFNILGGGNSLGQPEFSTFRTTTSYLCDAVEILPRVGKEQRVVLSNGGWQAMLTVVCDSVEQALISFAVTQRGAGEAWFQIPVVGYSSRKQLLVDGRIVTSFDAQAVCGSAAEAISLCGATDSLKYEVVMQLSAPASYCWPVIPVNVREPGVPPLPMTEAVTLLAFPLHQTPSVSLSLNVTTTQR